ncbi:MAG: hypothetical protein OXU64_12115 [Gemmatimonadota bacterium]|nr:hypothetical protein [Gemmatimonadota bacterium]
MIWEKGNMEALLPVEALGTRDSVWRGDIAAAGRVAVRAADSSRWAHVHVDLATVFPRSDWTINAMRAMNSFEEGPKITDQFGHPDGDLGLYTNAAGVSDFERIFEGEGWVKGIVGGPNDGYAYVLGASYSVDRRYRLNTRLDSADGPEELPWTDPDGNDTTVNHWFYLDDLQGAGSARALLDGVTDHETYGRGSRKGHQQQVEKALTPEACGDGGTLAERIVAKSYDEAGDILQAVEAAARATLWEAASHKHVYGHLGLLTKVVKYYPPDIPDPDPVYYSDEQGSGADTAKIPTEVASRCVWNF